MQDGVQFMVQMELVFTNSFKNEKNKEIRDNKIVLKNRILASESNLCLGSILLIKI